MVFHWRLSDSKSLQVSSTLLSILSVLNNVVVWMVSIRLQTSKFSSPFSNPLVTVPNAPITIGIIVTCMFHSFFNSRARSGYLFFFSHSFSFILWSAGTEKSNILQVLFFLLIIIESGLLAGIRWSICMLKSHRSLCMAFSRTGAGLCIYHLLVWSVLNFLHVSQWITLPTQSCLAFIIIIIIIIIISNSSRRGDCLFIHLFIYLLKMLRKSRTYVIRRTREVERSQQTISEKVSYWTILANR